jgi:tetratricopeptide (TPR) repeat protein
VFARFLSTAMVGALLAPLTPRVACAMTSAEELVREARAHETSHKEELALRRYSDALALDPTLADAYMGLAELRARRGDAREAERVYSVALAHLPQLRAALAGRARARWAMGMHDAAQEDLSAYAAQTDDLGALKELATWYGEDGKAPAQLATWRRLLWGAERAPDAALAREARVTVRALQIVVGPADPVSAPPGERADDVRWAVAHIARR